MELLELMAGMRLHIGRSLQLSLILRPDFGSSLDDTEDWNARRASETDAIRINSASHLLWKILAISLC